MITRLQLVVVCSTPLAIAAGVQAHVIESSAQPHNFAELWRLWGTEPVVLILLVLFAAAYVHGLRRFWRSGGARIGSGIKLWEAACFAGGWLALFIALGSPLHPWGS